MSLSSRSALLVALFLALLPGCRQRRPAQPDARGSVTPPAKAAPAGDSLWLRWDPHTGKGDVIHRYASGDSLRTCFHCRYQGYTGGLVIGNMDGSGMGYYPRRPIRGFRSINVFCAQDESIWDLREKREHTYGWSENFGKGDDGVRLAYRRGRVVESGPRRVILQSENEGGCYRVGKVAYTRTGVRWWIVATRITNTCRGPVTFDFFSGDDPWIGLYRSAEGDVGWTSDGLVRHEAALGAGRFVAGGLYDLGNQAAGQKEGGFSNQADFFALDPALPLPDLALFANSFAHRAEDVDPRRALESKKMIALNLGWIARRLAPGEGLTTAMALGLAGTGDPGRVPRLPSITDEDWSVWRRLLPEDNRRPSDEIDFAAERVELDLEPNALEVTATYTLRNRGSAGSSLVITYPIITAPDRPAPESIEVDGRVRRLERRDATRAETRFSVTVPPLGLRTFRVRYRQPHTRRRAAYLVTSARSWPSPIARAVFVIRHPRGLGPVKLSYPAQHTERTGDRVTHWVVRQPFLPEREVELSW